MKETCNKSENLNESSDIYSFEDIRKLAVEYMTHQTNVSERIKLNDLHIDFDANPWYNQKWLVDRFIFYEYKGDKLSRTIVFQKWENVKIYKWNETDNFDEKSYSEAACLIEKLRVYIEYSERIRKEKEQD